MFPAYILRNGGVTIATAITALQLKAGVNGPIEIIRAWATQASSTTSAQCGVALVRKTAAATVTIAVAGTNLNKLNPMFPTSDASLGVSASGFTASVEGTDGDILFDQGLNALGGWLYAPVPEERIVVPQAGIIGLKFLDAPGSAKWYCGIVFRELRGG